MASIIAFTAETTMALRCAVLKVEICRYFRSPIELIAV